MHGPLRQFKQAVEKGLEPATFVEGLKKQGIRVPGIGHRIKSKDNRDKRVQLLQEYARKVRGAGPLRGLGRGGRALRAVAAEAGGVLRGALAKRRVERPDAHR